MGSLLRWFVFSVAFGLLPFAFSVLLRLLHGEPPSLVEHAPELLFLALMLSAIQMGEGMTARSRGRAGGSVAGDALFCLFLLIAMLSAVVYGVHAQALRTSPCTGASVPADPSCRGWVTFQSNVYILSVWTAALAAGIGTFVEWTRARRSRWNRWSRWGRG